jgi:hypothetical protein
MYGIFMILMETDLFEIKGKTLKVSNSGEEFINFTLVDKCKYLLEYYLKSTEIFEVDRIIESDYKTELKGNMTECRTTVIKHLKNCPIGMWISIEQFLDYIKITDKNFLMNQVEYISYFSDKHRMYLEPWVEWPEVEGRFVEVILQEYLSVLGILDTIFCESVGGCHDYDEESFFKVNYFRITPLGAFVLGMSENFKYEEKTPILGFTINAMESK